MLSAFALSLSVLAAAGPWRRPAPDDSAHVVIVATTDVHGRATAWDYYTDRAFPGGLTRAATVVDSLRRVHPGQVVLLDVGDLIQGEPFATYFARVAPRDPHPIIETMNRMGYDAATLGNHEFNFGLDVMRRTLSGAAFPYVSANVFALPADTLAYQPYVVLRRGSVRIAVAGFTTPGVMLWDREVVKGKMRVGPIDRAAPPTLSAMRRDADLSVVLIHSGMDEASSYDTSGVGPENVAARFAQLGDRPDIVVVGHSHREMRDSVLNGVHFVQPKNYAQSLTVTHVDLVREGGRWRVARVRGDLVPLANVAPKPTLARQLDPMLESVRHWAGTPLADAVAPMPAAFARAEPTPLIEWIDAVQRERAGADLASTPAFDLRGGFDAGPITLAEVAAVYPYENTLRAIRISGDQLRRYLEHSARYYTVDAAGHAKVNDSVPGYNYDIVSGATYALDLSQPVGHRVRDLAVRGNPVAPTDSFTLALNSYRQAGGGGYDMLRGARVVYDRGENVRDLLAESLRKSGRLDPRAYGTRGWRLLPDSLAGDVRRIFEAPGGPPAARRAGTDSVLLRVLTINDLHGALLPRTTAWSKGQLVGGAAAIKATMDSAEARCGCPTIRLDAGDELQGTLISNLSAGRTAIEVMNGLGLRAAAVGNHDFDWSVDTLRARMREARYPWLITNVLDSVTGSRPEWAVPSAIVQTGGVRVGVIGWITRETKSIVAAERVKGLVFPGEVDQLRAAIAEVKAGRPDVTILLAHAGAECDSTGCRGEIVDLARALGPGSLDLIVAGHTHKRVVTEVAGIPIVEAFSNGSAIGVVDLVRKSDGGTRGHVRIETTWVDSVTPDPELTRLVDGWRAHSDSLASARVTTLKTPLPHTDDDGQPSALGDLIADALRSVGRGDVGLINNGGIRASLPAGTVTYGMLYEVQPFQNALVRIRLTGAELRRVVEHALRGERPSAHFSGITVRYDLTQAPGQRVRELRRAGGRVIRDRDTVTLATLDFVAGGGSGYTMLTGRPTEVTGLTDVDALILYLRRLPAPVEAPRSGTRLLSAAR